MITQCLHCPYRNNKEPFCSLEVHYRYLDMPCDMLSVDEFFEILKDYTDDELLSQGYTSAQITEIRNYNS